MWRIVMVPVCCGRISSRTHRYPSQQPKRHITTNDTQAHNTTSVFVQDLQSFCVNTCDFAVIKCYSMPNSYLIVIFDSTAEGGGCSLHPRRQGVNVVESPGKKYTNKCTNPRWAASNLFLYNSDWVLVSEKATVRKQYELAFHLNRPFWV